MPKLNSGFWDLLGRRKVVFFCVVTFFTLLGVGLAGLWPFVVRQPLPTMGVVASLISFATTLYQRWEPLYRACRKVVIVLSNSRVEWKLNADFEIADPEAPLFERIVQFLSNIGNQRRLLARDDHYLAVTIDGVSYIVTEIHDVGPMGEDLTRVNICVPEYHAPYSDTSHILTRTITPIFHDLEREFSIAGSYELSAKFTSVNPFWGLYTTRVPLGRLLTFECSWKEDPLVKGIEGIRQIRVGRESISLVASDVDGLRDLIERHLAIAGG